MVYNLKTHSISTNNRQDSGLNSIASPQPLYILLMETVLIDLRLECDGYIEVFEEFLENELSENTSFDIYLPLLITQGYLPNPVWDSHIPLILRHIQRLKTLYIDLIDLSVAGSWGFETKNGHKFDSGVFNSLKELHIIEYLHREHWDFSAATDATVPFYNNWIFPNVEYLHTEMHIPPSGVFRNLTTLFLDFSLNTDPCNTRIQAPYTNQTEFTRLKEFLESCLELKELTIRINQYSFQDTSIFFEHFTPDEVSCLKSVERFKLEGVSSDEDVFLAAYVTLLHLELQNVKTAEFCFQPGRRHMHFENGWMNYLLPGVGSCSFANLEYLFLNHGVPGDYNLSPLFVFFPKLRILDTVSEGNMISSIHRTNEEDQYHFFF